MARGAASRKYQLTINNPQERDLAHPQIERILSGLSSLDYWCLCDEIGQEGTYHTHLYLVFRNAVLFSTLQKRFYGAHIEPAQGSHQENRDYIRKEGKWLNDPKKETNLPETFAESGQPPAEKGAVGKQTEAIYAMVKDGASDFDILEEYPSAMNRLDKIERTRQTILAEQWKSEFRPLYVEYLWGDSGAGKTRSIMEQYGYANVYRATNYAHPFDGYQGQEVMVFEEFRSSLPISDMLVYLDGYPVMLPCRYADKQACYTKAYILSNIPLEKQYPQIQIESVKTWKAFLRRIHNIRHILPPSQNDASADDEGPF